MNSSDGKSETKIPATKLQRLGVLGSLVTRVASNMVAEGAKQIVSGKRPSAKDLLLTPQNAAKVAEKLSHLRGAAMKVGQLISMEAGDLLPRELTEILAKLRSDASPMPAKELAALLERELGSNWQHNFITFTFRPMAAASIGQVHEAYGDDGNRLAIKVQYPGVKDSIESDVDNVGTLLRVTGLVPDTVDYKGLLSEAKKQLLEEADYCREARMIEAYREKLAEMPQFVVPDVFEDITTSDVLAMSYLEGENVDSLANEPQAVRNQVVSDLFELLLKEIFSFRLVQTDPNFANYLYQPTTKKIALLDFGATRVYPERFSHGYLMLMSSAMHGDKPGIEKALSYIGFFGNEIKPEQKEAVVELVEMAMEPMRFDGEYDFANTDLAVRIREAGMSLSMEKGYWHTPPVDAMFLHRKIGGLYLLAVRLKAKVNVRNLLNPYIN
ncbi:ABC1 kinase family protein [Veronia pacifica]|uniref:Ubiquinol-cytochrome C reductase n=1 Tax=Veronia pacifica TaxID=1080227 RepID=A0A1C3EMM6_9GAMM|nr:AarF/ABC1/UbiB kinase family protein [Veronia pacifica]ODA34488.1 ubiquinol-cytochrome C reductase [Veronia pacifica]